MNKVIKEKPIGKFALAMEERQKHYETFFVESEQSLVEKRKKIIQSIVLLDSMNLNEKEKQDMEDKLYSKKREVERKLKNIYGQD